MTNPVARLDNLVWRAGLPRTIPAARQLITHGHINLGERRAKSPAQFSQPVQSYPPNVGTDQGASSAARRSRWQHR